MKLIKNIQIDKAMIDVWQDSEGNIILGGFNWIEYNDYIKLQEKKKE